MKARILNMFLVAFAGAAFSLMINGCSSNKVGGTKAALAGAGAACTVDSDCAIGLECEHGTCQPDAEPADEQGDDDAADDNDDDRGQDAGTAPTCAADSDCPNGLKCDDGVCKLDDSGDDGSGGEGADD